MGMSQFITTQNTGIYLQSTRNRQLYSKLYYRFTHFFDEFNRQRLRLKGSKDVHHFKYSSFVFLSMLIGTVFFQLHIPIFNSMFGPFHFNLGDFIQHVNTYKEGSTFISLLWRKEYIQVELGENSILNALDRYSIIQQYSDLSTRRDHIATYRRLRIPCIYVKFPSMSQKRSHIRFPFHFMSYSIQTLQCIVRHLPSNSAVIYRTWSEKSDYIRYINKEYANNATKFNKAVLEKCGVFIGYLYRLKDEKAFVKAAEYKFADDDLALNMTHQYFSPYLYFIISLVFIWLFVKSLFYLMRSLIIRLRCDYLHALGILSWPLEILPSVANELLLLNNNVSLFEQLIKFDEYLQKSEHKLGDRIAIIENNQHHLFVILFKIKLNDKINIDDESAPFIICPVTNIQKITFHEGICYSTGTELSWIPWPIYGDDEHNYSSWLHDELMEVSPFYRSRCIIFIVLFFLSVYH